VKLLLATRNQGKIREFQGLLADVEQLQVLSLNDLGNAPEVVENGLTFEENARKKASEIAVFTRLMALADDSGLEVDALGGAPGGYSARFAGESARDADNNRKLLELLADPPDASRAARFRCVLALAIPGPGGPIHFHVEQGVCEGRIGRHPRGQLGFGYDPLFIPEGFSRTMAELAAEEKNQISHRARAFRQMREYVLNNYATF